MLEGMGARTVGSQGYLREIFLTRVSQTSSAASSELSAETEWLVPYPDAHEMLGNILQGKSAHMILALDTTDAQQRKWAEEARTTFKEYAIPFDDMATRSTDTGRIAQIVARMLA